MSRVNMEKFERLTQELWEKHAHGDKHGYKDWMGEDGFSKALAEFADRIEETK